MESCIAILTFAGILEYLGGRDFALCTKKALSERSEFAFFVHAFRKISAALDILDSETARIAIQLSTAGAFANNLY